jgi:hypothetical protein
MDRFRVCRTSGKDASGTVKYVFAGWVYNFHPK